MIPANVHPLIFAGGADPLDEFYKISNSLRIRASASAYLSKATNGAPTNNNKQTVSFWVKRGKLGVNTPILTSNINGSVYTDLRFTSNDQLMTNDGVSSTVTYAPVLRDVNAWYHVCFVIDLTQTGLAKFVCYVNGVQASSSGTAPTGNSWLASGIGAKIGSDYVPVSFGDLTIAEFYAIDGQTLPPTSFAKTHPLTGEWRPIKYAGTYGNNGFYLPFNDTSNLTNLCLDKSGNNNNWTANNISLTAGVTYDALTDGTSNYANVGMTFTGSDMTVSDGGLKVTSGTSATTLAQVSQFGMPTGSGIWEWDTTITAASISPCTAFIGIVNKSSPNDAGSYPGQNAFGWSYYGNLATKNNNGSGVAYGVTFAQGDVIRTRFDSTNGTLEFQKQTGGSGGFVSQGVAYTGLLSGPYYPAWGDGSVANTFSVDVNFGQRPRTAAKSSDAQDLCVKNLKYPAVPKSSLAFVAVTDTGANVQTTLANARPGWANYIEIFKRQDSAEGWRWRFSDDIGNYLDSSSTAAKAAFPSLTGTSYMGYALKVAASNGVAMGRLTHTNGVADTVTDGLGNTRKMVILKNESTGTWYVYHPDLTAGKLFYLETTTGETTDATIGTILSNSFTVAAALASGTYRWIAFAEVSGFLSLSNYTANGSADGPVGNVGLLPVFMLQRSTSGSSCRVKDSVRSPYNVGSISFNLNDNTAQDTNSNSVDRLSIGFKERANDAMNVSGQKFITLAIGQAFRYANAL